MMCWTHVTRRDLNNLKHGVLTVPVRMRIKCDGGRARGEEHFFVNTSQATPDEILVRAVIRI